MEHLYTLVAKNKRSTFFLIFLVTLLFILVGYAVGRIYMAPLAGMAFAFIFSVLASLVSYYAGDSIVLACMHAEEADKNQYKQLYDVVEEMCIAGGIPIPKVYIIQSTAANAFATGRNPQSASIAVTTGILGILNREELQGVIGHEMSHVRNHDTLYSVVIAVMVGAIAILCDSFWRYLMWGGRVRSKDKNDGQGQAIIFVIAIILAILAPIVAKLIQLAMSRRREYLADEGSALLTRNPESLARALEKIAGDHDPLDIANRGVQHLFIVNPLNTFSGTNEWLTNLFSTHPPIKERIKILRSLTHTYSQEKVNEKSQ